MDRFAAELDRYLTREQPEAPECSCGNELHYEADRESGLCEECRAEVEAVEAAEDFSPADEALFVGALTEADVERFAAAETASRVAA